MSEINSDINSDDYYTILGVSRGADTKSIKKAYHRLAVKYHPDKNKDASAANIFKKINEAYGILSDANKRRTYNQFGKDAINQEMNMGEGFDMPQAHDIYNQFFAGTRSPDDPLSHFFKQNSFGGQQMRFQFHRRTQQHPRPRRCSMNEFKIPRGIRILITRLKASTELNGESGIVLDYSSLKKRYMVSVNNTQVYLKSENIQQIHGVKIINLEKNINLNGKSGKIIGFDKTTNRYQVLINGDPVGLKQNNILFKVGSLVKLIGLKNNSYLNNKWVKIIQCDKFANKYLVKTEDIKLLRVKYENVLG